MSCGERLSASFDLAQQGLVQKVMRGHSPSSTRGVDDRLGRWQRFIEDVEAGYDDSIYDFEYELDGRSVLQYAIERVPTGTGVALIHDLSESDQRFHLATTEIDEPIRERGRGQWWWQRIPKVLLPELANDLRDARLIS